MSQHDFEIANQGFPATRADLNNALQALASNSAGTSEPSTTYAYQFWYDDTNDLHKLRNSDNDAWITLAAFDQTNDEWEIRSAVIQAVDSAGVAIKTDDGTTRIEVQDDGDVSIDSGTLFVDSGNNRVGIGTTSPDTKIDIVSADNSDSTAVLRVSANNETARVNIGFNSIDGDNDSGTGILRFLTENSEAARIDSSGHLVVNATSAFGSSGITLGSNNVIYAAGSSQNVANFQRYTTDGEIVRFGKDGSTVGSIVTGDGAAFSFGIHSQSSGIGFYNVGFLALDGSGTAVDNSKDVGSTSFRFDDIHATNGTIQTSDRNEKQDIEELSEAEQRVAVAAKSLLRKFRWKDRVAEKGDDARIHFGIIAQDLQAAFETEGLDAGRYAMFIYSEWWEAYTDVPAVEAVDAVYETVTDEEGNETQVLVSEAVEAKEAYTRTDTYDTEEEAPEGAVKKSRMGVRYSELLAFIISAI